MTSTQTAVNARTARELAADLGVDCQIKTDGEMLVLAFRPNYIVECHTLEDACDEIRQYAKG